MRIRLTITLALALLLTSCGDDGLSSTTTGTVPVATTTTTPITTTAAPATTPSTVPMTTSTTVPMTAPAFTEVIWARIPSDDTVFGGLGPQIMRGVTVGGPGLVAVGYDDAGGNSDAAVWTSPDGITWSRIPHDDTVFGGPGDQRMTAVAVGGPGLVAVGYADSGSYANAAVWTSPDGITWTRVPHDDTVFGGPGDQGMGGVAAGDPGLVAVGNGFSGGSGDAAVWRSPDGITWARVPHDGAVFGSPSDQSMSAVAAGGPGLVAVGYDFSGGPAVAAVWTSPDGITWTRIPHDDTSLGGPSNQIMWGVAAGGPGLVAVGYDFSGGDGDAAVWTSPDGIAWTRIPRNDAVFGGSDFQGMWGVASGGPGLVAVGHDDSSGDGDAVVWTSPDGIIWTRTPHDDTIFGGPDLQIMRGVTVGGPGLVVVGYDESGGDGEAAVWTGSPFG